MIQPTKVSNTAQLDQPLVNCYIAIENGYVQLIYPLEIVIFHSSFVCLPEGNLPEQSKKVMINPFFGCPLCTLCTAGLWKIVTALGYFFSSLLVTLVNQVNHQTKWAIFHTGWDPPTQLTCFASRLTMVYACLCEVYRTSLWGL